MNTLKLILELESIEYNAELDFFEKYLSDTLKFNKVKSTSIKNKYDQLKDEISRNEFIDAYQEIFDTHNSKFPQIINHTLLVSIYSLLENKIRIVKNILDENLVKKKSRFENGTTLSDYYKTIKDWAKMDYSEIDQIYDLLDYYRKIRNRIVHHGSNVNSADKSKSKRNENKKIEDGYLFDNLMLDERFKFIVATGEFSIIDENYVLDFAKITRTFFNDLMEKLFTIPKENIYYGNPKLQ